MNRIWSGRNWSRLVLAAALLTGVAGSGAAEVRIKDMARIAGLDNVPLIGYGVVSGLRGTGDKDLALTKQTMANMLESFQITLNVNDVKSKNVAAVMVTAIVPAFHNPSDKVDVEISSLGDATSLEGGILLMTPLLDPNGELYALAQGALILGGYSLGTEGAGGNTVTKNHTTTAIVPGGATLRRGQTGQFHQNGVMRLILRHPDFTTASRMATAINADLGGLAVARDAATVAVRIPDKSLEAGQVASFVARLETLKVVPDQVARVIVNERTGTIVMGGDVSISPAVVAHGNLMVTVKDIQRVSQPSNLTLVGPQPGIRTEVVSDTSVKAEEEKARVIIVPATTTVRELADTLNLMGATPRDLISILEALHRLGALQMELVAM